MLERAVAEWHGMNMGAMEIISWLGVLWFGFRRHILLFCSVARAF